MGECAYFLKAAFPSEAIARKMEKKLEAFFKEASEAYNAWQEQDNREGTEPFWTDFAIKFPTVWEYIQSQNLSKDLSGKLDFGQDSANIIRDGNVLCRLADSVWHFANWNPLAAFIKQKFGAVKVVWDKDENGCGSLGSLNLYEWEDIVKDILNHKELHPLLIKINPELDTLLEIAIKKTSKKR
jgi:hypothetical protein